MPILNRLPEIPYIKGLLVVLALILLISVFRYPAFFMHEVLELR